MEVRNNASLVPPHVKIGLVSKAAFLVGSDFPNSPAACETKLGAGGWYLVRRLVGGRNDGGRAVAKEDTERENRLPVGPLGAVGQRRGGAFAQGLLLVVGSPGLRPRW